MFGDGEQPRTSLRGRRRQAALAAADRLVAGELAEAVFNVGTGTESTITELAGTIGRRAGRREFVPEFAPARPGSCCRSCLDPSRRIAALGLPAPTPLREGSPPPGRGTPPAAELSPVAPAPLAPLAPSAHPVTHSWPLVVGRDKGHDE
ncbi:hypothetical protein HBB16_08485 [Pseudonocardia sp. MCCB 268]|nr:hypothetical protein [Pseudonocardia cytotoxica]